MELLKAGGISPKPTIFLVWSLVKPALLVHGVCSYGVGWGLWLHLHSVLSKPANHVGVVLLVLLESARRKFNPNLPQGFAPRRCAGAGVGKMFALRLSHCSSDGLGCAARPSLGPQAVYVGTHVLFFLWAISFALKMLQHHVQLNSSHHSLQSCPQAQALFPNYIFKIFFASFAGEFCYLRETLSQNQVLFIKSYV